MDDGEHGKLKQMLDNFHRYGVTANINKLIIDSDNDQCTLRKFNVLMDCLIKNNSKYFLQLKTLIFDKTCSYIVQYLKDNVAHLIYHTKIDQVIFGSHSKFNHKKMMYQELLEMNISIKWGRGLLTFCQDTKRDGVEFYRA